METYYTYVLYSENFDRLYIGQTNNLIDRIKRHNSGYVKPTKPFRPWNVIFCDICESRDIALHREKYWKLSHNRRKIRACFINNKFVCNFEYQFSVRPALSHADRSEGSCPKGQAERGSNPPAVTFMYWFCD